MRSKTTLIPTTIFAALALLAAAPAEAQIIADTSKADIRRPEYSPHLHRGYPLRVYWGDTHLHTSYSTDAGMIGNYLGPDEAYRFARGEMVVSSAGVKARLIRPLNFLAVADHAENLGLAPMIAESNPELLKTDLGRKIHDLAKSRKWGEAYAEGACDASATVLLGSSSSSSSPLPSGSSSISPTCLVAPDARSAV